MDLFDKMVQVLGEESISLREFKELLDGLGLSEAKVGIIPPSTDQVLVGDMERTRLKDIQVLFFVGVNDGKIPREDGGGKILSELNREDLKLSEVALAPTAKRKSVYTEILSVFESDEAIKAVIPLLQQAECRWSRQCFLPF